MKRLLLLSAAISSLLPAVPACGSSRPRYGGTVRVLLRDRVTSVDPLADEDHPGARDRLAGLAFETLVAIDSLGRVRPNLAATWNSDPQKRSWRFRLRLANFHDGTVVTAADVAASLARSNPLWKYSAPDRQTVTIDTPSPVQHMEELLACPRYAIVKRQNDGAGPAVLLGTGPYRLNQWQADRAQFVVNDDYWGGRSFTDSVEFQMGATLREQFLDRQLGSNAAADVGIDQVRGLEQINQNVLVSRPGDLLAIVFLQNEGSRTGRRPVDARVREALGLAIDRAAINNVLLQRRGTPAQGLLPQWLTGYEFMFPGGSNIERAKELRADAAAYVVIAPIMLAYDAGDPLLRLVADRIALNAREAGIVVQPYAEAHVNSRSARSSMNADAALLRLPLPAAEPSVALASRADELGFGDAIPAIVGATRPEDLYEDERRLLESHRALPIAHIPEAVWLNGTVHNWLQQPTGAWQLDELWVEGAR